jgi:flagellin
MRINHNISSLNTYNQYTKFSAETTKSAERLSSGFRINNAKDDAAGLSISEKMRSQITGLSQASRNTQDGASFIQTAEGALSEVSDMLIRMKELSVQKTNGTYSSDDISSMGAEMDALGTTMKDIVDKTVFNGKKIFQDPPVIAYGEDGSLKLNIATSSFTGGLSSTSNLSEINDAISTVSTDRATYGAQLNMLDCVTSNQDTTTTNLTAAESRIRDVDMARELTDYTKNNILFEVDQSMMAQANSQPNSVLQLLRNSGAA